MKKKTIIQIILLIVCVVCIAGVGIYAYKWNKARHANEEVAKIAADSLKSDDDSDEVSDPLMDFEALYDINPDIYSYIIIPGTAVDYPILQSEQDTEAEDYYLMHNLDGSYGYPGCVYTQLRNSKDFSDPNTVIYGHNMKDGSMFASLHEYENDVFFEEHPYIYIYTPDVNYIYRIYAAYTYDDRLILGYYDDFENEGVFASYLAETQSMDETNGIVDHDVELDSDDRIITLSTCTGSDTTRFLVQAVRLSDEEKYEVLKNEGSAIDDNEKE